MRMRFGDLPIRHKITSIIMVACLAALSMATTASLVLSYRTSYADFYRRQAVLARITADNCSAAVSFQSETAAVATRWSRWPLRPLSSNLF